MIICTRKCFEHFVAIDSIKALFFIIFDALHLHILSGTSLAVAVAFATTTTPSSKKSPQRYFSSKYFSFFASTKS